MSERVLVDGTGRTTLSVDDRGLLYGDGVFETFRCLHGRSPLWSFHTARLHEACARLNLAAPPDATIESELRALSGDLDDAVVRLTLTRGGGPRGYALPRSGAPTRIVVASRTSLLPAQWYARGLRLRVCRTRLAHQPLLAGIKHLNRLEQVLARSEWDDSEIAEGLMLDFADNAVCATAANLFAVIDGRLVTPALTRCGVAGVARAAVLARRPDAIVRDIAVAELREAREVFLTSSVRGIVPVATIDAWNFPVGATTRELQAAWRDFGYAEGRV